MFVAIIGRIKSDWCLLFGKMTQNDTRGIGFQPVILKTQMTGWKPIPRQVTVAAHPPSAAAR